MVGLYINVKTCVKLAVPIFLGFKNISNLSVWG